MPTVTIRYTLPDEQYEFDAARRGVAAKAVLEDIAQHCRSLLKHGSPSEETAALAETIRRMIWDSPEQLID